MSSKKLEFYSMFSVTMSHFLTRETALSDVCFEKVIVARTPRESIFENFSIVI